MFNITCTGPAYLSWRLYGRRVNPTYKSRVDQRILHVISQRTSPNVIRSHPFDPHNRARAVRAETSEFTGWRLPLMDSPAGPCAPNAKIIEQQAGCVIPAHFHTCHQFQVVSAGGGLLGRKPVQPWTVHYTSPDTGYGPIEAGEEGLSYYVLRPQIDPGAKFMPQSRGLMRAGLPKHHAVSGPIDVPGASALAALGTMRVQTCLPLTPEGMAVWQVGLPPGERLLASELPGEGARFYLVTAGALVHVDVGAPADGPARAHAATQPLLSVGSLCFAERADAFSLRASPVGADVLVLQFPPEATMAA